MAGHPETSNSSLPDRRLLVCTTPGSPSKWTWATSQKSSQIACSGVATRSTRKFTRRIGRQACLATLPRAKPIFTWRLPKLPPRHIRRWTSRPRSLHGAWPVLARSEKVSDQVAVMQYLAQHTAIPVPKALGYGKCAVSPYINMALIEGKPLSRYLRDPS